MGFCRTTWLVLGFACVCLSACATSKASRPSETPEAAPAPAPAAFEEALLKDFRIQLSESCGLTFIGPNNRQTSVQLSFTGPCHFGKDAAGQILVYHQTPAKADLTKQALVLIHSSSAREGGCEGSNLGVMLNKGRFFIQKPPYSKYASCVGAKGMFDQKHYSTSWFAILKDRSPSPVDLEL